MNTHYTASTPNSLFANETTRTAHELPEASLNGVIFSKHAKDRMKQRSIKPEWVSLLLDYGHEHYQKSKHTYSLSLDKAGIKEIKRSYGNTIDLSKLRSLYVILTEESVIVTCAYR
ncbi:MAG: DUF4258 domain-containing protein [Motiliproteus sp.]